MARIDLERMERARVAAARSGNLAGWSHTPRTKVSAGSNFRRPENAIRDTEDLSHIGQVRRERLAMLGIGTQP